MSSYTTELRINETWRNHTKAATDKSRQAIAANQGIQQQLVSCFPSHFFGWWYLHSTHTHTHTQYTMSNVRGLYDGKSDDDDDHENDRFVGGISERGGGR